MAKTAISVKDLVKYYDDSSSKERHLALDNFNLSVPQGSIFGLLGPNGAGKSTLINILSGTVTKNSGTVKIMGVDIDQFPKKAKSLIGVVPQEIVFDTFFPLEQALEFTAGYFGIKPHLRKTEEILKALTLWDKRDVLPGKLSGGMKRRFLIAKAMVHSPKILVLDEPTAGVDIELRTQLYDYIKKLNKQGVTIIITTHYLMEAQELCDEIAFINYAQLIKQDSKKTLLLEFGTKYIEIEFCKSVNIEDLDLPKKIPVQQVSDNLLRFKLDSEKYNELYLIKKIVKIKAGINNIRTLDPDIEQIFHKIINHKN